MSDKFLKYKGYYGTVEFSPEDRCIFGRLAFIKNLLIMYEGQTIDELEKAFRQEVDAYLSDCELKNVEPRKPFKGVFNVRTGPDLHRKIALAAGKKGVTINAFFCEALEKAVGETTFSQRPVAHPVCE